MRRSSDAVAGFDLDDFMPYLLAVTAARVSALFGETYAEEFDITIPEWRVIAHVAHNDALSSKSVASRTSMDKVKVSRALGRLVDKGLIRRKINPQDARLLVLELTAAGRRMHDAIVPRGLRIERVLATILGSKDHAELHRLLRKLHTGLEAEAVRRNG